jgi:hypothetical protein
VQHKCAASEVQHYVSRQCTASASQCTPPVPASASQCNHSATQYMIDSTTQCITVQPVQHSATQCATGNTATQCITHHSVSIVRDSASQCNHSAPVRSQCDQLCATQCNAGVPVVRTSAIIVQRQANINTKRNTGITVSNNSKPLISDRAAAHHSITVHQRITV